MTVRSKYASRKQNEKHGKATERKSRFKERQLAFFITVIATFTMSLIIMNDERSFMKNSSLRLQKVFTGTAYNTVASLLEARQCHRRGLDLIESNHLEKAYNELSRSVFLAPDSEEYSKALSALSHRMLFEWLLEDKAEVNGVQISNEGNVRSPHRKGIRSTSPKAKGDLVLRIPRSRMLTLDDVISSSIGQTIVESGVTYSLHSMFGAFLAHERHDPDSHWTPYLRVLPVSFEHMPVFADEEVLNALKGSSVFQRIRVRKEGLEGEFERLSPLFPEMSEDDLIWGLHVSMSRAAGVVIEGKDTAAIIPLLNEMKHTTGRREVRGHFTDSENGFEIRAEQDIEAGHGEYLRNYGRKSAFIFYQDYGFVPRFNTGLDDVQVRFESKLNLYDHDENGVLARFFKDAFQAEKANVIGTWSRSFLLTTSLETEEAQKMLSYLRLEQANEAEWKRSQVKHRDPSSIGVLSARNEMAALSSLRKALYQTLNGFDTTIEHDLQLLKKNKYTHRFEIEMAIRMRISEKRVAHILLRRIAERMKQPIIVETYSAQSTDSVGDDDDEGSMEDRFDAVRRSVIRAGGLAENVVIRPYGSDDQHRGLHAHRAISSQEVIMQVPLSHVITSDMALYTSVAKEAISNLRLHTVSPHALMAVLLLEEASSSSSPFASFLEALPASFASIPIYYDQQKIEMLKGSHLFEGIDQIRAGLEHEFSTVLHAAPKTAKGISKDAFMTALLAVNTRNFRVYVDMEKTRKVHMLVPLVDMMDHNEPHSAEWSFDPDECVFRVKAVADIAKGAAIYTTYGPKPNSVLFTNYGFALPSNRNNVAQLRFMDDETGLWRSFIVSAVFPASSNEDGDADPIDQCLEYLRRVFHNDERRVLQAIQASAQQTLDGFETSLDEDLELLKDPSLDFQTMTILLVRSGEKKVCRFWIDTSKHLLRLITDGETDRVIENNIDGVASAYYRQLNMYQSQQRI